MTEAGSTSAEIVREVARALPVFRSRSILALVGIAIGTAAVIAMLHVGHNARTAALRQFEALGTDLVMMQPQSTSDAAPHVSIENVLPLPAENIGIAAVAATIQTGGDVRVGRANLQATLMAATQDIFSIARADLERGRLTSDLDGFAPFAVVGADIARQIEAATGMRVSVGAKIWFGQQVLTVIGILRDTPTNLVVNLDFNHSIVIPFKSARRLIPAPSITQVIGRLAPGAPDEQTAEAVSQYFDARMASGRMQVTTARQMIANIDEQMKIYALLILAIGAVSLVVGGVGIMNVMLMSVMERRQEIGLRLAVGARRADIRLMFLCETVILSVVGGTIGTALGYLAGWLFARGSGWSFAPAPLAVPLGAGMALVVGLFFGIYPAARAACLDPVTALRSDG